MNMMHRLLNTVNNVWNTQAKEKPLLSIRKGNGQHTRATLDGGQLHFHTSPYHETLPVKQTVVLEDLTIGELIPLIAGMGYVIEILPGQTSYYTEGAVILMPFKDARISISEGYTMTVFTSNVWRMLYPLARLLEVVEGDAELAMQQMYLRSSKSKWLDYWASFFDVKRFIGESDIELVKRIVLFLVNPKTNNRSIEELMKIVLGIDVEITDVGPAVFDVLLDADAMTSREDTDKLLRKIKAGGVWYVYNYYKRFSEDYDSYLRDATGKPLREIDGSLPLVDAEMNHTEVQRMSDEVEDTLNWLIEYPMEIVDEIIDTLGGGAELPHVEQAYRRVKQLRDEYQEMRIEYQEPRYRLKDRIRMTGFTLNTEDELNNNNNRLLGEEDFVEFELTSEVYLREEAIHAKMQEEILPFIPYFTGFERVRPRTETATLQVDFIEESYRFVRSGDDGNGFTLNVSVFNGDNLIMPMAMVLRPDESVRMEMTDSSGQVVKSLVQ